MRREWIDRYWIWMALAGSLTTVVMAGSPPVEATWDVGAPRAPKPRVFQAVRTGPAKYLSLNEPLSAEPRDPVAPGIAGDGVDFVGESEQSVWLREPILTLYEKDSRYSLENGGDGESPQATLARIDRFFTHIDSLPISGGFGGFGGISPTSCRERGQRDIAVQLEGRLQDARFLSDLERLASLHAFRVVVRGGHIASASWDRALVEDVTARIWKP